MANGGRAWPRQCQWPRAAARSSSCRGAGKGRELMGTQGTASRCPACCVGSRAGAPARRPRATEYTSGRRFNEGPAVEKVQMVGSGVALLAYLLGSLSFAVIVSRAMRLDDPRSYGSGNPGATNVLRSGNKRAAILTLLLDALKGAVAVLLARALSGRFGFGEAVVALAGLAAFL